MSSAAPREELGGLGNTGEMSNSAPSIDVVALKEY